MTIILKNKQSIDLAYNLAIKRYLYLQFMLAKSAKATNLKVELG